MFFVLAAAMIASTIAIGLAQMLALEMALTKNRADTDRAEYLSLAAVEHGLAKLRGNPSWLGTKRGIEFPRGTGGYYTFSAERSGSAVLLTGRGEVNGVTQVYQITVDPTGI